jgi:hypothetical protein
VVALRSAGDVFLSEGVIEVRRSVTKKRQLKSPKKCDRRRKKEG